jgi:glycosyltransferase involved in cell wall biosynthesis
VRLFLNSVAASAASGLTYIRNIVPHLGARSDVDATILTSGNATETLPPSPNLKLLAAAQGYSTIRRFWWEQSELPSLIRESGADVLISAGNFALRRSPVPQILLNGNALYRSDDFSRDLLRRGEYHAWLDLRLRSWFARRSIHWADCTVAPSQAFAQQLQAWSGKKVVAVHHGFDEQVFRADAGPLPPELDGKLKSAEGSLRLLYVSHYNYFRNFETLFRALPLIQRQMPGRKIKLLLTCELKPGTDSGSYDPRPAAALVRKLGIEDDIVQLGIVPYRLVHHVYKSADFYVAPSYAETFAHPTVEAMSCGLPIVASDLAVHREICQEAALYFPRFSPDALATCIAQVAQSSELAARMSAFGRRRASDFSWANHVESLLALSQDLCTSRANLSSRRFY